MVGSGALRKVLAGQGLVWQARRVQMRFGSLGGDGMERQASWGNVWCVEVCCGLVGLGRHGEARRSKAWRGVTWKGSISKKKARKLYGL